MVADSANALDPRLAALLPLDRPEAPLELAFWIELERPLPRAKLAALVQERLPRLPHAREMLVRPAGGAGLPRWQEAEDFSLGRHVIEHGLARRAARMGEPTLARLLNQPLPAEGPRWQLHTLRLDRHGALLLRIHLSWTEPGNEAAWLNALLDPQPQARGRSQGASPGSQALKEEPELSVRQALADFLVQSWNHWRRKGDLLAPARREVDALAHLLRVALRPIPSLPFHGPLSGRRTGAWCVFPQAAVRTIRNRLGGTTWEILIATALGGLSAALRGRSADVSPPHLVAVVPVDVRSEQDAARTGRRVTFAVGKLPLDVTAPVERLRCVSAQLDLLRVSGASEPLIRGVRWLAWAVQLGAEEMLRERLRGLALHTYFWPFPPIRERRYCAGVPVIRMVPLAPLTANLGLVFGLHTYTEEAVISFTADPERLCDLGELVAATEKAFASLLAAAESAQVA